MLTPRTVLLGLSLTRLAVAAPWVKRAGGPMYDESGKPNRFDIGQRMADCGFASSLAAVVDVNPAWISDHISFEGSSASVTSAEVTTWDSETLDEGKQTVLFGDMPKATDNKDGGAWWPWAIAGAAIKAGTTSFPDGTMSSQLPSAALQIITGLPAVWTATAPFWDTKIALTEAAAWDILRSARDKNSPVVVQTPGETTTLVGTHAYAVVNFTEGPDATITLYNPWGTDGTYPWKAVWKDLLALAYLKDFATYQPSTKAAGGVAAVAAIAAIQPSSSPALPASKVLAAMVVVTEIHTQWVTMTATPTPTPSEIGAVAFADEKKGKAGGKFVVLSAPSSSASDMVAVGLWEDLPECEDEEDLYGEV